MRDLENYLLRSALFLVVVGLAGSSPLRGAEVALEDCEAQFRVAPGEEQSAACFWELRRQTDQVDRALQRLLELHKQRPGEPWLAFYAANYRWSQSLEALELYSRAIEGFEARGDQVGQVRARNNRSRILFELGRIEEAGVEAERAYATAEGSREPTVVAHGKITLARHLVQTSEDLQRAYTLLREVEGMVFPVGDATLQQHSLAFLGLATVALGRLDEAERVYGRLVEFADSSKDEYLAAHARYGLTRVVVDRLAELPSSENRERALVSARQTLQVAEEAGHSGIEAKAHWILGTLSPDPEGVGHFERCAAVATSFRDRSYCLSALARRLARHDSNAGDEVIRRALSLAADAEDPISRAFVWRERMRVSWAAEPLDRAIVDSWSALNTIEALRELQTDGSEVQAGLFSTWTDDYHWFAGRLLKEASATGRGDLLAEAFAVSERLRARALSDWLSAARKDRAVRGAVPVAGGGALGFASVAQVQRALGPRESLLAFQVAPWEDLAGDFGGGSWVIAVTRRTVRAYPLPGRRELRQAVDLYTGLFEQVDGSEAEPSVHLFRQLLAPALDELPAGVDRVIVVPDDALHRLPFAALRRAAEAPPLATTHRISVAPSASLWLGWRQAAREATLAKHGEESGAAALILAAPAVAGSAAVPAGEEAGPSAVADLPPLAYARREGRAIAAVLGGGTELARGAAASEAFLARVDLSRFGILHLAAHAVTDEAHPERSAVVLAPGPQRGAEVAPGDGSAEGRLDSEQAVEDGLLRAGEIASLNLTGKLVVLSSCRSAAGTVLRGEGVMSLGRAFFQAGARTVVASLWPVRDDETAALFEDFYRHLARGETVAAALRAAQKERIAAGAPASSWAAFVVLGDGDLAPVPVPVAPTRDLRWVFAGAGVALLVLLVLAYLVGRGRLALLLASRRSGRHRPSDLTSAPSSTR